MQGRVHLGVWGERDFQHVCSLQGGKKQELLEKLEEEVYGGSQRAGEKRVGGPGEEGT